MQSVFRGVTLNATHTKRVYPGGLWGIVSTFWRSLGLTIGKRDRVARNGKREDLERNIC